MKKEGEASFHKELQKLMDEYAHSVYDCSRNFPRSELFGLTSQLRRAGLSVVLNYVEGYARQRKAVLRNFVDISYGSLKESRYLIHFSYKRGYVKEEEYQKLMRTSDRIGAMLWGMIIKLK